jgi:outer membrane protein assembly factor BamB
VKNPTRWTAAAALALAAFAPPAGAAENDEGIAMFGGGPSRRTAEAPPGAEAAPRDGHPAMFGGGPSRNMVSSETGLPATWDPDTGANVLWKQPLGSQAYGGPVIHRGRVYAGTNNEAPRNPKLTGDRGVMMVFDAETGEFLWQSAHEKLPSGRVNDWPLQGICSGPAVEGDRLYYVTNRAEVIAADVDGFRDGENDGPVTGEANSSEMDEDVLWKLDMIAELDVFPHNLAAGNPLIVGDLLFTVTGNGVDEGHVNIPAPLAPSFIAVDKTTGELVWEDDSPAGDILHGQWSNPAYAVVGGKPQVIFPGGDGWVYSFVPETGELIWKFDCNPKDAKWQLGGAGTRNNLIATPVVHDGKVYIGVGQDPEHGEGPGNLWAIDAAAGTGDVTAKAAVWRRGGEEFGRTISTVAIADGLLYAADLAGRLYCLDAATGAHHWTYDAFAAIWGSPYVADGKVYIGDEDGDVAVLEHSKTMKLLAEINMGAAVYTTPVAYDGVLYVMSRNALWALDEGAKWTQPAAKTPGAEAEPAGGEAAGGGGAPAHPGHHHGDSDGGDGAGGDEASGDESTASPQPATEPAPERRTPSSRGRAPEIPGRRPPPSEAPAR